MNEAHDDVFRGHEGQFGVDAFLDDGRVDDEAGGDVDEEDEKGVGAEVHVWDEDAADGAVVEGAFEPLGSVGIGGVFVEVCEVAAKTADAFGAHGVAFCRFLVRKGSKYLDESGEKKTKGLL